MKTVIDVVNELNGNLLNIQNYNETKKSIRFNENDEDEYLGFFLSNFDKQRFSDFVCTVDEFNACVDELSAATWIDGVSLEQWKAGMKNTVIDSHGNELELNKVYEFSDDQESWVLDELKECNELEDGDEYEYAGTDCNWIFIRQCQSPLGTIKKAPVKLVDGNAYQFENNGIVCIGIFDGDNLQDNKRIYTPSKCTNIIPLVPEVK